MADEDSAYGQGAAARAKGKVPTDNPYKRDNPAHFDWHAGWADHNYNVHADAIANPVPEVNDALDKKAN